MPDLERALRDLLSDDRLDVPTRPDATRIVHNGVRRRRRNRTIATVTAAAATVGVVVAAAAILPGALSAGSHPTAPAHHPSYDVPWVDRAAPKPWSPKPVPPKPPTMNAPRCQSDQLEFTGTTGNGATGHLFTTIGLRNVSSTPCLLIGTPVRVAAQKPGQPDVVATRGLFLGSGGVGGDLAPGHHGYLTVETDRDCPARYATSGAYPTNVYDSLSVTLPSGTPLSLPLHLDVECGLRTGGLGIDVPTPASTQPVDPRGLLVPSIDAPDTVAGGGTMTYVVTLTNPTGAVISLHHCPGYLQHAGQGGADIVKQPLGLNCDRVHSIGPGESVAYEMRMVVPADASAGALSLGWTLVAGAAPTATATVTVH